MKIACIVLMALALVAVGCDGDEESSAQETTQDRTWDAWTAAERGRYCGDLLGIRLDATGPMLSPFIGQEDLDQVTSNPPEAIRADVETIAQALAPYTQQVWDDPTLAERKAAFRSLGPEVDAAWKHVDAWARKNCGGN